MGLSSHTLIHTSQNSTPDNNFSPVYNLSGLLLPSIDYIRSSQYSHAAQLQADPVLYDALMWLKSKPGPIWIPETDTDIQLRLAIILHTGAAGHRGRLAPEHEIPPHFFCSTLPADIRLFVSSCIHYLSTTGGESIPSPFGPTIHVSKPNPLVQLDYIYIFSSPTGEKYVLLLRENHIDYFWLYPSPSTSA